MGEEDNGFGLGLSLSLGSFGDNQSSKSSQAQASVSHLASTKPPFPLNFFKSPNLQYHKPQRHSDAFQAPTAADLSKEPRQLFRGIDVNQSVTVTESEEENPVVSSPNSTVSSLSGKRSEREDRDDGERGSSSLEAEDDGGDAAARKKLRLSKEQAAVLEETFKEHSTLNPKQKMALAKRLDLMPRQVEVWFQNRRARTKLKQTEVDCEYLRRCCENLTEENRRLQKEVSELRALKLSPQLYANMNPPTTLTMCPQCERVACSTTGQPSHHHHQHQRPVAMSSWAAIISPQSLDATANRRPRT